MKNKLVALSLLILTCSVAQAYDGISNFMGTGKKTVSNSGTAAQLTTISTPCQKLVVTALTGNNGYIVVGGSTVLASPDASRVGIPLAAGQSLPVCVNDVKNVYIDCTVNGEGVSYIYYYN